MTTTITPNDLESLVFLTNGCLDSVEHISNYALRHWGLGTGFWDRTSGDIVDSSPTVGEDYPLTAVETKFTAEDSLRPTPPGPIDLTMGYSALVLTPAGPVKCFTPCWEAGFEAGERDEVLTATAAALTALRRAVQPLGGTVIVLPDQELGGDAFHHLIVGVPCAAVVAQFTDLAEWQAFLSAALS